MVIRIRLARFGKAHQPVYNIVVSQARTARGSKPLEVLGTYDPVPKTPLDGKGRRYKDMQLDFTRAKYWLGVGAQPSDAAWALLSKAGLVPEKYKYAEAKWRAETVDEYSRKVQAGEMNIKEYVKTVSQLRFFPGETEPPSDLPTSDPFAEDEAEAARYIRQEQAATNESARSEKVEERDDAKSDFDRFFRSSIKRGPSGLLEKTI